MRCTARRRRERPAATATTQTLAARPGRLTAAGLVFFTVTVLLLLLWAVSAHASVWVITASDRAFPGTAPTSKSSRAVTIDAAGNEYQGVQVCLRGGGDHTATLSWTADSDPLIVANAKLHRVYYVNVTTPTSGLGAKRGPYPDPLVPRSFGEAQRLPGSTTPMYVLVHVPYGTAPGTYNATLHIVNGGETVDLPFSLRVWNFGWTELSTSSAFSMSAASLAESVKGRVDLGGGESKRRILTAFFGMMHEHGVSPTIVHYLPSVSARGNAGAGAWADKVAPLLNEDGVNLQDNQLPWLRWFPWSRAKNPTASQISTYLTEMCRVYKQNGWEKKAYIYMLDETTKLSEERQSERYARLAHNASAKSGFRIRFLLTDDPRPRNINAHKRSNKFLYDDVDIWALRYFYFFGRIPAVRERQRAGKEIWWYTYTNYSVRRMPSFVIDKPHIDSRAMGWIMERWGVDGLLNWGFNRWGKPVTGNGWRDPYRNPLSFIHNRLRSNGCTSLVYPGYYPRYGLTDPYAPPVSSLRLEALRDGFEEREYVHTAEKYPGGSQLSDALIKSITTFPYKIQLANVFNFPVYSRKSGPYDRARLQLASFIEEQQQAQ